MTFFIDSCAILVIQGSVKFKSGVGFVHKMCSIELNFHLSLNTYPELADYVYWHKYIIQRDKQQYKELKSPRIIGLCIIIGVH